MSKDISLLGIGSSIVDIIAYCDEGFLERHNLDKGSMTLIDLETSNNLLESLEDETFGKLETIRCSGGSVANTIANYAKLGSSSAFITKVKHDDFGKFFVHDLQSSGAMPVVSYSENAQSTNICKVFVTKDEKGSVERTMATFLDFSISIEPQDISLDILKRSNNILIEGYCFDNPITSKTIEALYYKKEELGFKLSISLSDSLCVERNKKKFDEALDKADIIFGNELEYTAMFGNFDIEQIAKEIKNKYPEKIFCITLSERGCIIVADSLVTHITAAKVDKVVDVTGAGDMFCAGFLYGYGKGYDNKKSAEIANILAARVISYVGGRPQDLSYKI